ncbi:MAG: DUF5777 family beta-barrel protein [Bacteroidota bacterium]|nr:DUF5777 family beta-barrel protein [Bacteroidota bacterium]
MKILYGCALFSLLLISPFHAVSQDDLLDMLGEEKEEVERVTAAFKSTRVIGSHSLEHVAAGVLDFRIMHRFGELNTGSYELFGLDQATIRLGLDYGITDRFTVGIGRSSLFKELDGFLKYKLLWQSTGAKKIPVTIEIITGMTSNMLKWSEPERKNYTSSRFGYYYQLIIGRKFSDVFSLQISPLLVHRNLVERTVDKHDIIAIEVGTRIKLTQRLAITADYFYVLPDQLTDEYTSPLSIGLDIETGGHVFQLHFTNAPAMNEKTFITETTGKWEKGDIHFGFNISRVFTISDRKRKS